jgi:photosystem II stability/assembly factor-like uncharacterized protein
VRGLVETVDGVFDVDLETEEVLDFEPGEALPADPLLDLPFHAVSTAAHGSTWIAVVDRRPPLVVSYDAGVTWTETGGGLPSGNAVAISDDDPDVVLFGARNRLYLSRDGGRFWSALVPELPEIRAVSFTAA